MKRLTAVLLVLLLAITAGALAQGRKISTFPYTQDFTWVTGATTGFPVADVDGGEFTSDAGTSATWTASITSHGLNNNGGAGGGIRLQSTGTTGPAGLVWYGDFTSNCADSLVIDWSKVTNGTLGTRTNELRIATNGGAGATFTDLPVSSVVGGAWPQFDNQAGAQSGILRVKLPSSLSGSADARVRIYSVNISGSGNQPRVVIDNLNITVLGSPTAGIVDSVGNAGANSLTLFINPGTVPDSVLVVRRTGSAPMAAPVNGTRYTAGQGLNATDTVVFVGPSSTRSVPFMGLQSGTVYHFAVYGLRTCNGRYSASAATGSGSTLVCSGAPANITSPAAVQRWQDSIRIGFTTGSRTDSVLIIRRRNTTPAFVPADGTRYAAGQVLNSTDVVAYIGPAISPVMVRGLQADSQYVFALYGFQSCNATYSPVRSLLTARTYCIGTVSSLSDASVRYVSSNAVGFTVAGSNDATGFIVFSNGPDTLRPVPTAGVAYNIGDIVGDDTVRYLGPGRLPVASGLAPGTAYRFTIRSVRMCNYYYSSGSDTVWATTLGPCVGGALTAVDSIKVIKNVFDTLQMRWRPTPNANGYLLVARIDSTPMERPVNSVFYVAGDTLGNSCFILGKSTDTSIRFVRLPANVAYFVRVYAYKDCDLAYSPSAPTITPVATRGSSTIQRFAIRAGSRDTIRFAGSVTEFRVPVTADGSLLIGRNRGPVTLGGIPMQRNNDVPINAVVTDRWWTFRKVGLGTTNFNLAFDITGIPGIEDTSDLEVIFRTQTYFPWEDLITTGYASDTTGHYLLAANRNVFALDYAIGANTDNNTLPVKLISFEGFAREGRNVLRWRTASEADNAGFRLYRAPVRENAAFTLVADYMSHEALRGAGTTNQQRDYGFVDASADLRAGAAYVYKLEEVSLDGSASEAGRLVLAADATLSGTGLSVAPNPAASEVSISYALGEDGPFAVTLVDGLGQTVRQLASGDAARGSYTLRADLAGIPAGTYFCRIATAGGSRTTAITIVR